MAEINQNPIVVAIVSLLGGGTITAILARVIPSKKERLDDATAYRAELRSEIAQLQMRQDLLERAVDDWQKRYWDLYADYARLKSEHATMKREMSDTRDRLTAVEQP